MVETLTDNRNRTAADLRHYFDKNGGNLGAMGCVAFLFNQKGVIDISLEDKDADEAMMDALDAGAEDFDASEDAAEVTTDPEMCIRDRRRPGRHGGRHPYWRGAGHHQRPRLLCGLSLIHI